MLSKNLKQFIKFCIIGILNSALNLGVLYILTDIFKVYYLFSAVAAFLVAVTNSYFFNNRWTFKGDGRNQKYKYTKFLTISIIALVANLIILYVLVEYFKIGYITAQIIGIFSNLIINFLGNKLWTFRDGKKS